MFQQTAPAHNFVNFTVTDQHEEQHDSIKPQDAARMLSKCIAAGHSMLLEVCRSAFVLVCRSADKHVICHGGSNACPLHTPKWNLADGSDSAACLLMCTNGSPCNLGRINFCTCQLVVRWKAPASKHSIHLVSVCFVSAL
jgi:hypothetical protein